MSVRLPRTNIVLAVAWVALFIGGQAGLTSPRPPVLWTIVGAVWVGAFVAWSVRSEFQVDGSDMTIRTVRGTKRLSTKDFDRLHRSGRGPFGLPGSTCKLVKIDGTLHRVPVLDSCWLPPFTWLWHSRSHRDALIDRIHVHVRRTKDTAA